MGGSKFLNKCSITTVGSHSDWKPTQIPQWVNANGGTYQNKISNQTTHLVVSEKAWKTQTAEIRHALELKQRGKRDIKIVSFDWLADSLSHGHKEREKAYLWAKLDPASMKRSKKSTNEGHEPSTNKSSSRFDGAKSHSGMLAEVFHESTDNFLDEEEKKRIEKHLELEQRAHEELEAEERAAKKKSNEAEEGIAGGATTFKRGAKKARKEIFSENHHIYADETNFKYDVALTKVDITHNRNERWNLTLQIYESNSEPHTYATNTQFAGTGKLSGSNLLAAIGSNFPTAFRAFKKMFKEKTGVEWDDRIIHAAERSEREKFGLGREREAGFDMGMQKGQPMTDSGAEVSPDESYADAVFQYYPPTYGPRGALPRGKDIVQEARHRAGSRNTEHKPTDNERIEAWMNSANGDGPEENNLRTPLVNATDADTVNVDEIINTFIAGMENGNPANVTWPNPEAINDYPFDFPFNRDDLYLESMQVHQDDPAQQDPAGAIADNFSFFGPAAGELGETQLAEGMQGEFEAFNNKLAAADESDVTCVSLPQLDLGSSSLGKRKSPPFERSLEQEKKLKVADVVDEGEEATQSGAEGLWFT